MSAARSSQGPFADDASSGAALPADAVDVDAAEGVAADTGGDEPQPWPHGISREATMRISDVLSSLSVEFPAVSHSKLRFLEEQGLVEPVRTASGYRMYSRADVERLRFVLIEQRDRYLPLKVIKDKLSALDAGMAHSDQPLIPRLVATDGHAAVPVHARVTTEALASVCKVDVGLVEELVNAGVLRPDGAGQLDSFSREVVLLAASLSEYGLEPRHLRSLRSAADRHVSLVDQVVSPLRGQQSPAALGRAGSTATELGELLATLHTVWVRQGVQELPGG